MIVGNTYHNKHNGRTIEINRVEVGDSGYRFYYAGDHDMFIESDLDKHWEYVFTDGSGPTAEEVVVRKAVQVICDYCDARNEYGLVSTLRGFLDNHFGVDEE